MYPTLAGWHIRNSWYPIYIYIYSNFEQTYFRCCETVSICLYQFPIAASVRINYTYITLCFRN